MHGKRFVQAVRWALRLAQRKSWAVAAWAGAAAPSATAVIGLVGLGLLGFSLLLQCAPLKTQLGANVSLKLTLRSLENDERSKRTLLSAQRARSFDQPPHTATLERTIDASIG